MKHAAPGFLSMGNSGKNSNSSQFFFTLAPCPACDGKHTVFGRIVSGIEVLRYVEATAGTETGAPKVAVKITDCGEYAPGATPGQGFWIDVPDAESFTGRCSVRKLKSPTVTLGGGRRWVW